MKNSSLITFLIILGSCSDHIAVRTDSDKDIDISKFPTFVWLDKPVMEEKSNPLYNNELNDKRIKNAVVEQLKRKGYVMEESNPALKVHYHIVIEDKTQIRSDAYSEYWIDKQRDLYRYREGTLIVDLMDAKKEALLWRGWATSVLNDSESMSEELIRTAVEKMLRKLPASSTSQTGK